MAITKRRITITVEISRRSLIRPRSSRTTWCDVCSARVESLPPEQLARILHVGLDEVYLADENGELHFSESVGDELRICVNSLKTRKRND